MFRSGRGFGFRSWSAQNPIPPPPFPTRAVRRQCPGGTVSGKRQATSVTTTGRRGRHQGHGSVSGHQVRRQWVSGSWGTPPASARDRQATHLGELARTSARPDGRGTPPHPNTRAGLPAPERRTLHGSMGTQLLNGSRRQLRCGRAKLGGNDIASLTLWQICHRVDNCFRRVSACRFGSVAVGVCPTPCEQPAPLA